MNLEKNIKEYEIEFAIEKITLKIAEKIKTYKETKDKNVQKELVELLDDRGQIYCDNKEIIKKYLNK